MTRVLGVDLGSARVGLALSDPLGATAQPLEVIDATDATAQIVERIRDLEVTEIVVGIPFRLDGSRGPEAEQAEMFAHELEELTGLPVTRWDERLSTVEAERTMRAGGTNARRQRGVVDKVAAAVVLQAYLESRRQR
jgi:putative holliday junction resolvase